MSTVEAERRSSEMAWWEKDRILIERLQTHPCTTKELLDLYMDEDAAGHRLRKLTAKRKIKRLSVIQGDNGRPRFLYATRYIKPDWIEHEYYLTQFCAPFFQHADFVRGNRVDKVYRPDAEMTIGGKTLYLEMDCGTETIDYLKKHRFRRYQSYEGFVFWICLDRDRAEYLRANAQQVSNNAFFGVLSEAQADPFGEVWRDFEGHSISLGELVG